MSFAMTSAELKSSVDRVEDEPWSFPEIIVQSRWCKVFWGSDSFLNTGYVGPEVAWVFNFKARL